MLLGDIYIVVANVLQIEERYVPVQIYLICVLIGILLNSYTIGSNLYKLFRGNIVEKIRNGNDYIKTNKINVKGVLVRICISDYFGNFYAIHQCDVYSAADCGTFKDL